MLDSAKGVLVVFVVLGPGTLPKPTLPTAPNGFWDPEQYQTGLSCSVKGQMEDTGPFGSVGVGNRATGNSANSTKRVVGNDGGVIRTQKRNSATIRPQIPFPANLSAGVRGNVEGSPLHPVGGGL